MPPYTKTADGIILSVRVVPRASKNQIVGIHDGALKVLISSAPVDGAANAELIKVLAKHFGVAKGDIHIQAGATARIKRITIANLPAAELAEKLK